MRPLVIAVDFDGTIAAVRWPDIGQPLPGAVQVLKEAKAHGDTIIVHTCRCRPDETIDGKPWLNTEKDVRMYLDQHSIPYDDVTCTKPLADIYIDDKAIQFIDWDLAERDLASLRRAVSGKRPRT